MQAWETYNSLESRFSLAKLLLYNLHFIFSALPLGSVRPSAPVHPLRAPDPEPDGHPGIEAHPAEVRPLPEQVPLSASQRGILKLTESENPDSRRLEWKTLNLVKDGLYKATETKQFIWQPGIRKKIEFPPKTKLSKKEATFWCHLKASASEKTNTVTSQTVILNTAENS